MRSSTNSNLQLLASDESVLVKTDIIIFKKKKILQTTDEFLNCLFQSRHFDKLRLAIVYDGSAPVGVQAYLEVAPVSTQLACSHG